MYNPTNVYNCLKTTVNIDDAAIYAPTYITDTNLILSSPNNTETDVLAASILKGSITKMMGDVIRLKKLTNEVKTVIDDFALYEGRADFNNKNANYGRFVGFEIQMKGQSDLSVNIPKISLQIDTPCPNLTLYLFSSEQDEPIATQEVGYDANRSVVWFDMTDFILNDSQGVYYIGYFESDLAQGAQSINKRLDLTTPPCQTCGGMEITRRYYLTREKYMFIQPIYVDADNLNGTQLFDTDATIEVDTNNWGLNFKASVNCDISNLICKNTGLFYDALSMRLALDLLEYILHSTRDNAFVDKVKDGILFIRDGGDKAKGLTKKYEDAISALNIDLSGFNSACLPCTRNWASRKAYIG